MNLFGLMEVSGSAMKAERIRAEVVASNMANAETTRTADGGPYRRQHVVFGAAQSSDSFASQLTGQGVGASRCRQGWVCGLSGYQSADRDGRSDGCNKGLRFEQLCSAGDQGNDYRLSRHSEVRHFLTEPLARNRLQTRIEGNTYADFTY